MAQRTNDCAAFLVDLVEQRVQVGQEAVADVDYLPGGRCNVRSKRCWILVDSIQTVVVAEESVESAQLHPASALFWRGISKETANVRSDLINQ